ncbi:hypothetical protein V8C37DRAFT_371106 [Trichoderma ceciliae]
MQRNIRCALNQKLSTTTPLVFVHHGLAPCNIFLDPNGRLWLIDWDCTGFCSKSFKYAGMYNFLSSTWSTLANQILKIDLQNPNG